MRILLVALIACLLAVPAEAKEKKEKVQPHADDVVKTAKERFDKDFAQKDMDKRLRILKWYGLYMHKDVLKRLKKIWLKDKNVLRQRSGNCWMRWS